MSRIIGLAVVAALTVQLPPHWLLAPASQAAYRLEASGNPLDSAGSTITLSSKTASPAGLGTAFATVPADTFHGRRIRVVSRLRARDLRGEASIWLRVDGPSGTLLTDDGKKMRISGSKDWTTQVLEAAVPDSATKISFGVLMQGAGAVEAAGYHVEVARQARKKH